MSILTIVQHSFRYFSYSQALVATIMILGALWLRLTTGWYAASFLIFVFGLTCVYMSVACFYAWKNWFLEGDSDPALEKKRRKSMVVFIVLGGFVWSFFGLSVIVPVFSRVNVYEFDINRTPQFDRELQGFLRVAKGQGFDPVNKYSDTKLAIQGEDAGLVVALSMFKKYNKDLTKESHIHRVDIDNNHYKLTLLSHQSHFGWVNSINGSAGRGNAGNACQFFIPFKIEKATGEAMGSLEINDVKPTFINIPQLNSLDVRLVKGELVVNDFLDSHNLRRVNKCRKAALEYQNVQKNKSIGTVSLLSAPIDFVRYLAFPGFNDGVINTSFYETRVLRKNSTSYFRQVERVSRRIFD